MGCDDLIVVFDHKPLTKLLGDRTLDEISNPRLFRIKQRTLPWIYEIMWLPGKSNSFSDATSRHPNGAADGDEENIDCMIGLINSHLEEDGIMLSEHSPSIATIKANLNNVTAITWEKLQQTTSEEMQVLFTIVQEGFLKE